MPKYGDIIKQAKTRKPENQKDGSPEDQQARQPEGQREKEQGQEHLSIDQSANQVTRKPEDQQARQPDKSMKNLCVKVPESWRRHWAAHAKLTGRTMTDVMVEALKQEFGLPDDQTTR